MKKESKETTVNKKKKKSTEGVMTYVTVCHKSMQYVCNVFRKHVIYQCMYVCMDSTELRVFCNALKAVTLKRSLILFLVGYSGI